MNNQNIETFLTSTNLNQNYKLVCQDVNSHTGINIDLIEQFLQEPGLLCAVYH